MLLTSLLIIIFLNHLGRPEQVWLNGVEEPLLYYQVGKFLWNTILHLTSLCSCVTSMPWQLNTINIPNNTQHPITERNGKNGIQDNAHATNYLFILLITYNQDIVKTYWVTTTSEQLATPMTVTQIPSQIHQDGNSLCQP